MATYLLTWNPAYEDAWTKQYRDLETVRRTGSVRDRWSVGHTRRIRKGDRLFLLRQGLEPRGIVASGYALGEPFLAPHWNRARPKDQCRYVWLRFDAMVDPEVDGVLRVRDLRDGALSGVRWRTQNSGITIAPEAALELEARWSAFLQEERPYPSSYPDDLIPGVTYPEGALRRVTVNAYERDPEARAGCIRIRGVRCIACRFDFEATYGDIGKGFIHVHHRVPLARIRRAYSVNPATDLVPVCPNCHAMLHATERKSGEVLSVEALKAMIEKRRGAVARPGSSVAQG